MTLLCSAILIRQAATRYVSDVITFTSDEIKPPSQMGTAINTDYLIGIGTLDQRMLILIDIARLMSAEDIGLIEKLAA